MKLWVFDFDDTLVKTDSVTHVTSVTGAKSTLTPAQFAAYERQPGDTFDYSEFEQLVNPRPIQWVNSILLNVYAVHGPRRIVILTARGHSQPIYGWLATTGVPGIEVAALGDTRPEAKASWISARINRDTLTAVELWEDSPKNIAAVEALRPHHPGVAIATWRVTD